MNFLHRSWWFLKRAESHSDMTLLALNPHFIPKKMLRDALRREAAHLSGSLAVDVGCGWQPYRHFFNHFQLYIGLDLSLHRMPAIVSTADSLPLADNIADVVLCTEVIEHTKEPKQVCQDLARVLKPGGTLLLSAPMSWNLHYEPYDYFRFTRYGLAYLVEEVGLEVVKVVRVGGLLSLIGARLSDIMQRKLPSLPFTNRWKGIRLFTTFLLVAPINLLFFILASLFDGIDDSDAIGWLVVCVKSGQPTNNI